LKIFKESDEDSIQALTGAELGNPGQGWTRYSSGWIDSNPPSRLGLGSLSLLDWP